MTTAIQGTRDDLKKICRFLIALTAIPYVLFGIASLLAFLRPQVSVHYRKTCVVVVDKSFVGRWFNAHGWGGFTLGRTIFLWGRDNPRCEFHERVHARQLMQCGIAFWPVYIFWFAVHGYRQNPFEIEAYRLTAELG